MQLTRRDAVAALAAVGVGGVALHQVGQRGDDDSHPSDEVVIETMTTVATVVYPAEVSGIEAFVETYLVGRLNESEHATGLRETVEVLRRLADEWHGKPLEAFDRDEIDTLLHETGADTATERPDGTDAERIRYYIVNELLLALYSSPTGGELVGLENPQGHPGGTESYQREMP